MATDVPSAVDRIAASRRMIEEAWNAGDVRAVDAFVDPSFVSHDPTPEEVRGPDGVKAVIAEQRRGFPDFRLEPQELFAHDDKVVMRWRVAGTHRGMYQELAPTERRVAVEGITIDRWAGDRVVESWTAYDTLSLLQQIGAAPAHGSKAERAAMRLQHLAVRTRRFSREGSRWVRERRGRSRRGEGTTRVGCE